MAASIPITIPFPITIPIPIPITITITVNITTTTTTTSQDMAAFPLPGGPSGPGSRRQGDEADDSTTYYYL